MTIHQLHLFSIVADEPNAMVTGSEANNAVLDFMSKYGNNFRTFKHGAFHGFLAGLFLATPILTVNALFERKKFKYIAINAGYWIVSFMIMGGVLCAFT